MLHDQRASQSAEILPVLRTLGVDRSPRKLGIPKPRCDEKPECVSRALTDLGQPSLRASGASSRMVRLTCLQVYSIAALQAALGEEREVVSSSCRELVGEGPVGASRDP